MNVPQEPVPQSPISLIVNSVEVSASRLRIQPITAGRRETPVSAGLPCWFVSEYETISLTKCLSELQCWKLVERSQFFLYESWWVTNPGLGLQSSRFKEPVPGDSKRQRSDEFVIRWMPQRLLNSHEVRMIDWLTLSLPRVIKFKFLPQPHQ